MNKHTEISIGAIRGGTAAQLRDLCRDGPVVISSQGYGRILTATLASAGSPIVHVVGWSEFRRASVGQLLDWLKPITVLVYGRPAFVVREYVPESDDHATE